MHTHQRQVYACLYPAQHPFDILLIGILVAGTEESACVIRPPGDSCSLHAQSSHNLTAEGVPVVAHIAAPHRRAVALDARESAAGEDHRLLAGLYQPFVDRLVHQQRIYVPHLLARPAAVVHHAACEVVVLRLRSVLPPGVDARRHQPLVEVLPIGGGSVGIEEVYPVGAGDIVAVAPHLLAHLRVLVDLRPHAEHQPYIHLVQTVCQRFGVRVVGLVELHGVPAVLAPPLPVLHEHAHGHPLLLEAVGRLEDLLRRVEALAAVDVTQRPFRHLWTGTRQLSVGGDNLVGSAYEHGVVHRRSHG